MAGQRGSLKERFWSKVDKSAGPNGCWLWTGALDKDGYGKIGLGGKDAGTGRANRVSWELHKGPIPRGMHVLHNCPGGDNPACVNPRHLFLGTIRDNTRDAVRKGQLRPWRPQGVTNGNAKLTEAQVLEIRALVQKRVRQKDIAERYRISVSLVEKIGRRVAWRHI